MEGVSAPVYIPTDWAALGREAAPRLATRAAAHDVHDVHDRFDLNG